MSLQLCGNTHTHMFLRKPDAQSIRYSESHVRLHYLRYKAPTEILVALDLLPLRGERRDSGGILPVGLDLSGEAPPHCLQELDLGILPGQQRLVRCLALQTRGEAHPCEPQACRFSGGVRPTAADYRRAASLK